jgi:hypothetical protein
VAALGHPAPGLLAEFGAAAPDMETAAAAISLYRDGRPLA